MDGNQHFQKILFIIFFTLSLAACDTQTEPPLIPPTQTVSPTKKPRPTSTEIPTATPEFDYNHYEIDEGMEEFAYSFPRVASSTSAYPLWSQVICDMFNMPCLWHWGTLQPPNFYEFKNEFDNFISDHVVEVGTHDAYLALIDKQADIILVARAPSEDELAMAQSQGVEFDIQPVALDAFVFIVNTQNPVDNLSIEQIRGIYSGTITNWKALGWEDSDIHAYQRNENSGSQELMEALVMDGVAMIDAPDMIARSMGGPYIQIGDFLGNSEGDIFGIGYSVYFYAQNMVPNDDIEFIGVNGVEPTSATIANGRYPLITEVYVVIRSDEPTESIAVVLRDWLLSKVGQHTVRWSGYVPIDN